MKEPKSKKSSFSKLSKKEKIKWVQKKFLNQEESLFTELEGFQHPDLDVQKKLDNFSENTLCNFPIPFGVAPHFLINNKKYCVPMVIEESSVVAAASNAAKYWSTRGGISAKVIDTVKLGHIHLYWTGEGAKLYQFFISKKYDLLKGCKEITAQMEARGGGILSMQLLDKTEEDEGYFQIEIKFETCDSMGANFINSVLEKVASLWKYEVHTSSYFFGEEKTVDIILCILSNYNPECLASASVSCKVKELGTFPNGINAEKFAYKFYKAVRIAKLDTHRAATHNKGIFNGIDAIVLATGNDFRAIEACGHTYAAANGKYQGLSDCSIENGIFTFRLEMPVPIGTVGGLTKLHPLASKSLELLGNPNARELMQVIVSTGLMQNFGALRSLVTTGIQKGHMKMHLSNILNQLHATEKEFAAAVEHFGTRLVSFSKVREYLDYLRNYGT